jgi:hypothetical protein
MKGLKTEEKQGIFQKILNSYYKPKQDNVFLPTFQCKMLEKIQKNYKNHHLIIADFDMLKGSSSAKIGINAPVVSQKLTGSHEKRDFENYLVKRGEADIFFPTDF